MAVECLTPGHAQEAPSPLPGAPPTIGFVSSLNASVQWAPSRPSGGKWGLIMVPLPPINFLPLSDPRGSFLPLRKEVSGTQHPVCLPLLVWDSCQSLSSILLTAFFLL